MAGIRAGLVGVGPVGDRIYCCLKEREIPLAEPLRVMATRERREILAGEKVLVREISPELFEDLDVVFFAGREGAKGASVQWGSTAIEAGAYVIDNGGDYRLEPDVPLVVPEVNMDTVTADTRFITSPNCSTTQMCVALAPLHRTARIKRIVVSTYQAASGWGAAGQEQLQAQLGQLAQGQTVEFDPCIFCRPLALDCIPHIDAFLDNLYTKEEMKMVYETQKIFEAPDMGITATAVRVPVEIGHSESINVEFADDMDAATATEILQDCKQSPSVVVIDGPTSDPNYGTVRAKVDLNREPWADHRYIDERAYPSQADILREQYKDQVLVGRVRDDVTRPNTINFWCVADNLRKGAATNVVQIAEEMLKRGLIPT
ncbi:MAG: aspartate-semialdehyde dehydrogenase [candidate division WS1 bacterium]|jgi:aspartate-semialdehyde dehydrogenase|nr:aspartate-semialdehyde dehydrogenase [candidate division WS1 bacterium]